jgi:translation initiation factor IF-3
MIVHQELGKEVIERFIESLQEVANVEAQPKMDGRTMFAVVAPKSEKDKEKEKKNN